MPDEPGSILEELTRLRDGYRSAAREVTRQIVAEGRSIAKVEELAYVAADYADREVEAWRGRPEAPEGIACRAGCSYCCHVQVATTVPEILAIAGMLVEERTPEELALIRERIERHYRAGLGPDGGRRRTIGRTCPLLEAGSCSIHEYRPLACRGWNSLDVVRCLSFYQDPGQVGTIPTDPIQRAINQGIAQGMQAGLESRGLAGRAVELVAALRIALDDPTAADRWLAGEPAFRDAEQAPVDPEIHEIEMTLLQ